MSHLVESLAYAEHHLRPSLLKFLGPKNFIAIYSKLRPTMLSMLSRTKVDVVTPHHPRALWGLSFRNDVGNAAGLDKDGSLLEFNYRMGAGFAVVGTVLHKPHTGNLYPMLGDQLNPWTPLPNSDSAINSLGLPGKGIQPVLQKIEHFRSKYQPKDFPIGLSIMGHPAEDGEEKIRGVESCLQQALPLVDFIEINESCPNVQHHDHSALAQRIDRFCKIRHDMKPELPLWFKFAECPDPQTLNHLNAAGVQALVLTNTQTDYSKLGPHLSTEDQAVFRNYTQNYKGGLSGKVIQGTSKQAILKAKEVIDRDQLQLQLIHVGGLKTYSDMQDSRTLTPLREWYSGYMEALGSMPLKYIYPSLF
jgi:dihydroorotate dehydrogenase